MQIGRREHYMLHAALSHLDWLEIFYTDTWSTQLINNIDINNKFIRKIQGRYNKIINQEKVVNFNISSILLSTLQKFKNNNEYSRNYEYDLHFQKNVLADIQNRKSNCNSIIGYAGQSHYIFEKLKYSFKLIIDQYDPGIIEDEIIKEEYKKWEIIIKRNEVRDIRVHELFKKEWYLSDKIIVNSEWSKKCIASILESEKKIVCIPLCYEPNKEIAQKDTNSNILNVLWLGTICLRKGFMYLLEAAKKLKKYKNIRFNVVGNSYIELRSLSIPNNVYIKDQITKREIEDLYLSNDIFILPTLSDGFAITQIEAQSYGLPVIATKRCGNVVVDGESGYLVEHCNSDDIVDCILKYHDNRNLLKVHTKNSILNSKKFSFENYLASVSEALSD